ncbi:MAG: hypothetical protein LBF42_02095 [Puniceicoccales bacterium]|jgi:hypothetical protein|nr:hypothetical protein [Puniceicoccales bacterium]
MFASYTGAVHDNVLGVEEMEDGSQPIQGNFRGQDVTLNPKSKSMIEEADELDGYIVVRRKEPQKLKIRDILDRKMANEKSRLLYGYVRRLDKQQGTRQYQDYEARLRRLKQRAIIQEMERRMRGENSEKDGATLDDRPLSDIILEDAAETFDEVTEQDNAVEYMEALEDFESEYAEGEIRQATKMLQRLEGRTDKKGIDRQKDFQDKIEDLSKQIKFSKLFKKELANAKAALRSAHGQEIKDGYNLIPKASDLFASLVSKGVQTDGECTPNMLTNVYRLVLAADGFVAMAEMLRNFFGKKLIKKYLGITVELLGEDMKSANPSRSVAFLIAIRDALFMVEVLLQIMQESEKLNGLIGRTFKDGKRNKPFNEDEEFETTKDIAKFSRQTYVNSAQLYDILTRFGVEDDENDRSPAIFTITQLMELIRRLPIKFFEAQENRIQVLESMQSELDELIILEEQEQEEISGNKVLDDEDLEGESEEADASNVIKNA